MNVNVAVVQFPSGYKNYHFKNDIVELSVGDTVVCDTVNGLAIGQVVGFEDASAQATKWIVQKVDMEKHKERVAKQKRIDELKKKMEQRRKELQDIQIYMLLAKEDEAMKGLLDELLTLEGKR